MISVYNNFPWLFSFSDYQLSQFIFYLTTSLDVASLSNHTVLSVVYSDPCGKGKSRTSIVHVRTISTGRYGEGTVSTVGVE